MTEYTWLPRITHQAVFCVFDAALLDICSVSELKAVESPGECLSHPVSPIIRADLILKKKTDQNQTTLSLK